ncbi:MAG: hypothetical protein AB1393_13150 [Candidatus Edwardsbacteria bacterium]
MWDAKSKEIFLILLGTLIIIIYLQAMFFYTSGHFAPQGSDLFVFFKYAQQFVRGHPFQYNTGDLPTTGATSLTYTLILALAYLVGFKGLSLLVFALFLNGLIFVLSILLMYKIGEKIRDENTGLLLGILFTLCGALSWGFMSGMDLGLFVFLLICFFYSFLKESFGIKYYRTVSFALLLGLTRPEGLISALSFALVIIINALILRRKIFSSLVNSAIPILGGIGVLFLNYLLTGDYISTSARTKILSLPFLDVISIIGKFVLDSFRGIFGGAYPIESSVGVHSNAGIFAYFPPFSLIFFVFSIFPGAIGELRSSRLNLSCLTILIFIGGCLFAGLSIFTWIQYQRYLMWIYPIFIIHLVCGVALLAELFDKSLRVERTTTFWGIGGFFIIYFLIATVWFTIEYGRGAGSCYFREMAMAEWIKKNLPADIKIGALAGGTEYLTDTYLVQISSICFQDFQGIDPEETAAQSYEILEELPEEKRPSYWIISDGDEALLPWLIFLRQEPPLWGTNSFSDKDIRIYKVDFKILGKNRTPRLPSVVNELKGMSEVDYLNVCNPHQEKAHKYFSANPLPVMKIIGYLHKAHYPGADTSDNVLDSGRLIMGGERFVFEAKPRQKGKLVLRTTSCIKGMFIKDGRKSFKEYRLTKEKTELKLYLNGKYIDNFTFLNPPENIWDEWIIDIPAEEIQTSKIELAIVGEHISCYWWFFQ